MAGSGDVLTFFTAIDNQGGVIVKEPPKLDLDLYIQNYKGRTRFERLYLIGRTSVYLCIDSLKGAVNEAKNGKDVSRYREAWECLRVAAPKEPEAQWDNSWVENMEKANRAETQRLESELKQYKNNLIKESIRMGHEELGRHFEEIGDLQSALDIYSRMRPDVSTTKHLVDVGKHLISIGLQRREWATVAINLGKIMTAPSGDEEKALQPYQKVVNGLQYLGQERYRDAAASFLDTGDINVLQTHNDIVSANDVANYGGLLGLASMNRSELQSRILDNPKFRSYLELEPHIRKAVSMFVNGRYPQCLEVLERHRADYLLDIYLQKHVATIYSQIRSKCIVQHFIPFSCVTLDSLNAAFAKPGESLQDELIRMVRSDTLKARINTIDKLLVAVSADPRIAVQTKALDAAKAFEKESLERIRRMSVAAADLEAKGSRKNPGAPGGSGVLGSGEWVEESKE